MIQAENIHKSFGNLEVLKGVSLSIKPAEIVSIVGASGAGKTTLLQIIGSLLSFDSGKITINNIQINSLGEKQLAKFRNRNIGFVFQFHHLLPEFTAFENVCIPGFIAGTQRSKVEDRAKELLNFLRLDHRLEHKPNELSGGEQQRVAVARALINSPAVILADEPSGNLDSRNKEELHELFLSLREKLKQTIVIVTHDDTLANMADKKLVMHDGQFVNS